MPRRSRRAIASCLLGPLAIAAGLAAAPAFPAGSPAGTQPAAASPAASPAAAPPPGAPVLIAPMDGPGVIEMLDQTVDWYRTLATQQQFSTEPSDLLILYENRQIANQVSRLAFDVARASAALIDAGGGANPGDAQATASAAALARLQSKLDAQAASVQGEIDGARRKLAAAPGGARRALQAKLAELQGELDLIATKKDILSGVAGVVHGGGSGTSALRSQIDAMAVALPTAGEPAAPGAAAAGAPRSPASGAANLLATPPASTGDGGSRFGLWSNAQSLFDLSEKISAIEAVDRRTEALQQSYARIRARLVEQMRAMSAEGDSIIAQADAADSQGLIGVRRRLDGIARDFKEASAILIPLSKQGTLLEQYRRNLHNWRDAVQSEMRVALRALGIRLGILLLVLALVFSLAEVWHRAVLKYVQESRRRYQLLLLRKIALWTLVVIIVGFTFASELGSIVTFAGLITAGLAVAMQSVLVSIVGYFFLIGKYGIRIGDRVQIGEVNGEIIELGLVRMYLMELAGQGSASPTGRIVAFPNSVVFQVSSGLFKQIPGVNLTWHDITLALPAGADYAALKERLFAAAGEALADHREEIQRQSRELHRTMLSGAGGDVLPTVRLIYSAKSVDAHVRYPVHIPHAAEIDERMSKALLQAISGQTARARADSAPAG